MRAFHVLPDAAAAACAAVLGLSVLAAPVGGQAAPDPAAGRPVDAVARLQARMARGETLLPYDTLRGWLPAVLDALDVPVESQTLVFSRTSLQTDRIGPWAPRALYFNDDVYVGFVQDGALVEIAAVEATGGTAFYSVPQAPGPAPRFERESTTCLMCHESRSLTGGVPGLIVRSVLTDRLGYPITELHPGVTTGRTPLAQRWGGWYVTGAAGAVGHAANTHAPDLRHEVPDVRRYRDEFDFAASRGVLAPGERFDPTPYLTPHSDVVALSVLTHQVQVHNLMAMAHEAAREAARESGFFGDDALATVTWSDLRPSARVRVDGAAGQLVGAMFFAGERPWPGPLVGESGFAEVFEARGRRDEAGRSLRDLDLETRLFRHPLSFLIHSEAFDALPALMRDRVYDRILDVLTADAPPDGFEHLTAADRRAILEILRATQPGLPGR